jgi:hypothetical protein
MWAFLESAPWLQVSPQQDDLEKEEETSETCACIDSGQLI